MKKNQLSFQEVAPFTMKVPQNKFKKYSTVELGVIVSKTGKNIPMEDSLKYATKYCLFLNMTSINVLKEAKEKGLPWDQAKGYDTFSPVSEFLPVEKVKDPQNLDLWLKINGKMVQQSNTKFMIHSVAKLIHALSQVMTLEEGDFIATGTPEGVGPIKEGDVITAGIEGFDNTNVSYDVIDEILNTKL
jgi:acylpyruvate hydrolase